MFLCQFCQLEPARWEKTQKWRPVLMPWSRSQLKKETGTWTPQAQSAILWPAGEGPYSSLSVRVTPAFCSSLPMLSVPGRVVPGYGQRGKEAFNSQVRESLRDGQKQKEKRETKSNGKHLSPVEPVQPFAIERARRMFVRDR